MNDKQQILYGTDDEKYIVGVERHGEDQVTVYKRDLDSGEVRAEIRDFLHFLFITEEGKFKVSRDFPDAEVHQIERLKGDQPYQYVLWLPTRAAMRRATRLLERSKHYYKPKGGAETMYLMQTGKTLFGGMTTEDVHRMQVDIETISSTGSFPQAKREGDEVIIISITDNRGLELVMHQKPPVDFSLPSGARGEYVELAGERQLLTELVKTIHRYDPDVLELHNGFGFDLPYLRDRCERHDVNFILSRSKKPTRSYDTTKKFGNSEFEYTNFTVGGRAILDTMFMAIDYDVYAREFESYGLKYLADYFGVSPADRTYVEGDKITEVWQTDPGKLLAYALDDVIETRGIGEQLGGSVFYLAQMVPMEYQTTHLAGTSGTIETLLTREYLNQRHSLPKPDEQRNYGGGYTDAFERGVFYDLCYADVSSLYPSIMLKDNVEPSCDDLHAFQPMLRLLTDLRLEAKAAMGEADGQERQELNARQQSYKILINSFYGMMGFAFAIFNDFDAAEHVTHRGRRLLKRMIMVIDQLGGHVVSCDTDGVMFELPREGMTDEEVDAFVEEVSSRMPMGINIDNDGRYKALFTYKKKNYVTQKWDGSYSVTGNSLKGRGMEKFMRGFMTDVPKLLIHGDYAGVRQKTRSIVEKFYAGEMPLEQFEKKARLHRTVEKEDEEREANPNKSKRASYEIARVLQERRDMIFGEGDTVRYYVAGTKPKSRVTVYEDAKPSEDYAGDENTAYYVGKRLREACKKFKDFFSEEDYEYLFDRSEPDLFGTEVAEREVEGVQNIVVKPLPHKQR